MTSKNPPRDPWIVQMGSWLTKRRGILLSPLFAVAFVSARWAPGPWGELTQDLAGLTCILGGTWLRLVAASYHESDYRSEPITAGPYAWVRHPLYVANFLLGLGITLLTGWGPMLVAYGLFFIPLHLVIMRAEEVHLTHLYGDKYSVYHKGVSAVFPWRRYRGPHYGIQSNFKLRKGRERLKVVGYLAGALGILFFKQFRQGLLEIPLFHQPLPHWFWFFGPTVVALAVMVRTQTHSAWLKASQTVLAVVLVLLLAIHLPGVWYSLR